MNSQIYLSNWSSLAARPFNELPTNSTFRNEILFSPIDWTLLWVKSARNGWWMKVIGNAWGMRVHSG